MKRYQWGIVGVLVCLLLAPLIAPIAAGLAQSADMGEGAESIPPASAVDNPKTISQLLEMIYEQIPQSGNSGGIGNISEADYKVLLTDSNRIVTLKPHDYLRGAVAAEMSLHYDDEALKAQIVATHTYAVSYKIRERSNPSAQLKGADISDDPAIGQAYIDDETIKKRYGDGAEELMERLDALIAEVGDFIMVYEGEPIVAAYHAISCGKTESAQNIWGAYSPYLIAVDSTGDEDSPDFLSKVMFSANDVKSRLTGVGAQLDSDEKKWFSNLINSPSGYVTAAKFGNCELTGSQLRELFGLRSACFTVSFKSGTFTFTVKGWGHGVGMSQYGAQVMAQNGSSYTQILKKYYAGVSFCEL